MRTRLNDIARTAGVSRATVDRVINGRAGVKPRTRDIVIEAAVAVGYLAAADVAEIVAPTSARSITLDFLLPHDSNPFMHLLGHELHAQSEQRTDVTARVHFVESFNPTTLAAKLAELEGKTDGVGLIAIDHPTVRAAIRKVVKGGAQVVTLVSDLQNTPRFGYVGIDNRIAGRLAGYLMTRFLGPGRHKVALFTGSASYRGHEEREMGFRQLVAERHDQLEVVAVTEVHDDDDLAYAAAKALLKKKKDVAAVYNIGAGIRGIANALVDTKRSDEVVLIGHDLTEVTKAYLLSGTIDAVIDQYPRVEAREAIEQLTRAVRGLPWSSHPLRTQIILQENVPEEFM